MSERLIRFENMATRAVPDRLKFDIKATAVDGSNTMKTTPADGSDYYRGEAGSTVCFVVPHSTFSDFCDPTMSRFRFQIQVLVPNNMIPYDNSISLKVKGEPSHSKEVVFLIEVWNLLSAEFKFLIQVGICWKV